MKLKKLFSSKALQEQLALAFRRFPVPIIFLSVACCLAIANKLHPFISHMRALSWAGSLGVLSTLAINLWCEFLRNKRWQKALLIIAGGIAITDFFFIEMRGESWSNAEFLAQTALTTALIVAVIFPPTTKNCSRQSTFTFSIEQIRAGIAAMALCLILWIASCIILGTIALLFHYDRSTLWYCMIIISAAWIPGLFYFTQVPTFDNKDGEESALHRTIGNATIYVLLPLVAIYTLILYIYGLKILFTWTLPTDSLSTMVSGLLCVSLVTLYGLQAFTLYNTNDRRHSISQIASRWLPIILLPLLILMTVGLCYRINEYGLTVSRAYLATFVVWAFAVTIYLAFKASTARLNKVASSFAVIFLLVSIFPYLNYTNLTVLYIQKNIKDSLSGLTLPADKKDIKQYLKTLPEKEASLTASRIEYLYENGTTEMIREITPFDGVFTVGYLYSPKSEDTAEVEDPIEEFKYDGLIDIPEGYRSVFYERIFETSRNTRFEHTDNNIVKISSKDLVEITVNTDSIDSRFASATPKPYSVEAITPNDSSAIFIITSGYVLPKKGRRSQWVTGYLFEH